MALWTIGVLIDIRVTRTDMQSVTRLHAVSVSTVLLVVLIAGCLSGVGGSQPSTATDSPEPIKAGSETPCAISLAFYGPLVESEYSQPPDEVSIGFAIQGGAHVMFVAEENETILGTSFTAAEHNS